MLYSLFWKIPALILFLLLFGKSPEGKAALLEGAVFRPARDFPALALCFPVLLLSGYLVSFLAAFSGFPPFPVPFPAGALAWAVVVLASLSTGYLEEAYFRIFLPAQCAFLGRFAGFWFPILLFGLCHAYEGLWGFINAFLAGFFLSLAYRKTLSLHGIALAHGFYNISVYLMAALDSLWK
ncbi:MAG: CPBP family intramembrane metalloprotease [Spirochaetaceae bacterium]|jgi:membrane protease YdiL (CAAX protease family)|nr:CPBP family intramembrane metalloprotease [Spirochaetaceae bacterium]